MSLAESDYQSLRSGAARRIGRAVIALGCCGLALVWSPLLANDEQAAEAVVTGLYRALAEVAAMDPAPDLAERIRLLAPIVTESHDLDRMGRMTVSRRHWRDLDPADRNAYLEAFRRLTVATYASRFASIGPDVFELRSSQLIDDDQIDVHAVIHRPADGTEVSMDYSLLRDGQEFRIAVILADGVDELNLMASDNFAILDAGGDLSDLIAALEAQLAEL